MKRPIVKRLLLGLAVSAIIYGAFLLGFGLGEDSGSANYHNLYMRHVQVELSDLRAVLETGDLSAAEFKLNRAQEIAGAAGNSDRFLSALSQPLEPEFVEQLPAHSDLTDLEKGSYLIYFVSPELLAEERVTIDDLLNNSFGTTKRGGKIDEHQQFFDEIVKLQKSGSTSSPKIEDHVCLLVWRNSFGDLCRISIGTGGTSSGRYRANLVSDSQTVRIPRKLVPLIFDLLPEEDGMVWKSFIKGHLD